MEHNVRLSNERLLYERLLYVNQEEAKRYATDVLNQYDVHSYSDSPNGSHGVIKVPLYHLHSLRKGTLQQEGFKGGIKEKMLQLGSRMKSNNFSFSFEMPDKIIDEGYKDTLRVSMHCFLKITIYGHDYRHRL